jgi:hypothetical protein
MGFDDPSGKEFKEYEKTLDLMEEKLLRAVKEELLKK